MSEEVTAASAAPEVTPSEVNQETSEVLEGQESKTSEAQPSEKEIKELAKEEGVSVKEMKKRLQIKVDGKVEDVELDLNNEDELKKHLQLSKVAQKRMAELADMKKQVNDFLNSLKSDPTGALTQMGFNFDELAENHINKKIEEMKKSPEQIEMEKLKAEVEKHRKEKEEFEKQSREKEIQALQEKYAIELDRDITSALEASKDLPKSPYVIKRIADTMITAIKNGYPNVTAKEIIPIVTGQIKSEIAKMFEAMPEEVMEAVIGKSNLDRMRKKRLSAQKKAAPVSPNQIKETGKVSEKTNKTENEKITYKDFFRDPTKYVNK